MGLTPKKSGKLVFFRKPTSDILYTWSPDTSINKPVRKGNGRNAYFCTATPGSNGEDWISGYIYNLIVVDGKQKKLAYVECNYIE